MSAHLRKMLFIHCDAKGDARSPLCHEGDSVQQHSVGVGAWSTKRVTDDLRMSLHLRGWTRLRGLDFCPRCSERAAKRATEVT